MIVVENRPGSSATSWMLAEEFPDHPRVRYVDEPWPGLSRARNAGLALADGELVAFTDDDVLVEPGWLARCVAGFERSEDVACVTGLILPPGLESDDELFLEQFIGVGKGFQRRIYRLGQAQNGYLSLLLAPGMIGSGANTVLRADVARELGGFDVSLGAGTRAGGGEALDLYVRLLRDGRAVAYEPSAIVWHTHPDGASPLRRQVRRHGVGLGALLTKQLITGPERREALRAVPASIGFGRYGAIRSRARPPTVSATSHWRERLGMLIGAHAYSISALGTTLRALLRIQPADAGEAQRSYVERLVLPGGETLDLAPLPRAGTPQRAPASRKRPVDEPGAPRHGRDRCSRVRASAAARRLRGATGGRPPRPHRPPLPGARDRSPHPRPREAGGGTDAGDRAGRGSRRHPGRRWSSADGGRRRCSTCSRRPACRCCWAASLPPPARGRPQPHVLHGAEPVGDPVVAAVADQQHVHVAELGVALRAARGGPRRRRAARRARRRPSAGRWIAHGTTCSSRQKVAARSPAGS